MRRRCLRRWSWTSWAATRDRASASIRSGTALNDLCGTREKQRMCSISGFLATDFTDKELIMRMNAAQRHRGPDDSDVWKLDFREGQVALGNTRLAIIDTSSAGHQPMLDLETGNCITYNGETYNFKDLAARIRVNPRSKTDTEVVLRWYTERGLSCFDQIRGMFALAIWDERERELVLARDRFGIKPLY